MAKDYNQLAKEIVAKVGGEENAHARCKKCTYHCSKDANP